MAGAGGGSAPHPRFEVARELTAGALANMVSSALLNPCDVVKIRLQTQGTDKAAGRILYASTFDCARQIVRTEGVFARWGGLWFPGLAASMMREASYSSFRFGLYTPVKRLCGADKGDVGLLAKVSAGAISGATGSLLAVPTDVVKIRFQREAGRLGRDGLYETGLAAGQKPSYVSTLDAFRTIYKERGLAGMWVGWQPTMARAALLAGAQLSSYDHTKYEMKRLGWMQDGVRLHVIASLVAGIVTLVATQPADTIKTRIMAHKHDGTKHFYAGPLDCLRQTVQRDGWIGLYRGSLASYLRFGPHFIIALPLWEQCRRVLGLGFV